MIKQTLQEWLSEGKSKFGGDLSNWKFRCPACGHVASGQDFKDAGAELDEIYTICIGRKNGRGADGMKGKDHGDGCNWAAFGLFGTLGKGRIVVKDGKDNEVFDFAEAEYKE